MSEQRAIVQRRDEPTLAIRDMTGKVQAYTVRQIMDSIMPPNSSYEDTAAFMSYCAANGANPFAKECFPTPRWTNVAPKGQPYKGGLKIVPVLSVHFFERIAAEGGRLASGVSIQYLDVDGNELPKWAPEEKIVAAMATVYLKGEDRPHVAVVTMAEAEDKSGKDGAVQGKWKEPEQRAHMLGKTARKRVLQEACPPPVGLNPEMAAMVMAAEAQMLSEEALQEGGGEERIQTPLDAFAVWCREERVDRATTDAAKEKCGWGSRRWQDLTADELNAVMVLVKTAPAPPEPAPAETPPVSDLPDELEMQKEYLGLAVRVGGLDAAAARKAWAALEGPDAQLQALQDLRAKAAEQPEMEM